MKAITMMIMIIITTIIINKPYTQTENLQQIGQI
jgi:hypothetical protein